LHVFLPGVNCWPAVVEEVAAAAEVVAASAVAEVVPA
jgi:hypothetical protein